MLVYGCSLTKDNYIDTWADLLATDLGCQLMNYAERGAGYKYIAQKVISTEDINPTDLVCIMWPAADRLDLYVNRSTPHLVSDLNYCSWLDGKSASFVDYDCNYISDSGWYINGGVPRGYKNVYYKYFYNQTSHINEAWSLIVLIQNYLKNKKIDFVMCNSFPLRHPIQYHDDGVCDFNWKLYDAIDFSLFVDGAPDKGFVQLATEKQFNFFNPHYPDSDAHLWYAETYIKPKIFECK